MHENTAKTGMLRKIERNLRENLQLNAMFQSMIQYFLYFALMEDDESCNLNAYNRH